MHNTPAEHSRKSEKITQPAIESYEKHSRRSGLPVVARTAVIGDQFHAGKSAESANHSITAARRAGKLTQIETDTDRYLVDPDHSDETLLDCLRDYLERADEPTASRVGATNARIQDLREADSDE